MWAPIIKSSPSPSTDHDDDNPSAAMWVASSLSLDLPIKFQFPKPYHNVYYLCVTIIPFLEAKDICIGHTLSLGGYNNAMVI